MAAGLVGAVHAPLTAILVLFEMTGDYHIILPLVFAVVVSMLTSQALQRESVYRLALMRKGICLERGRDVDVMESVTVGEVMLHETVTLPLRFPVSALADKVIQTGRRGFAVLDENGNLFGIISVEDYRRATSGEWGPLERLTVGNIATRDGIAVFPDETVGTTLRRMVPRGPSPG